MSMDTIPAAPLPLPDLGEMLAAAHVVRLPLNVRFRGVTEREIMLFHGPSGWAEWAPFLEYDDADAARWLASAVETGWGDVPAPVREVVPVNATLPAVDADQVAQVLSTYDGCRTAKVKVAEPGQDPQEDVDRVAAARQILGPHARIRVDANGGWTPQQAREVLGRLARYDLEYAEQPCPTVAGLAEVRLSLAQDGIDIPIAADESIRRAEDPLRVAREGAADLIVVKVAPLGGIARALQIVEQCGLPAVVSSAIDSSVGLATGVALAAALPTLEHDCGLGTGAMLAADVVEQPLVPVAGAISLARAHAALEAVDEALLTAYRASPERENWWRERLTRAHALLR